MASFENESTSMKFSLTVDDAKKTVLAFASAASRTTYLSWEIL